MIAAILAAALVAVVPSPNNANAPQSSQTAKQALLDSPVPQVFPVDASWIQLPLGNGQYAAYARRNPGKPADLLSANKRPCDCQPADAVKTLESDLNLSMTPTGKGKNAQTPTSESATQICGQPAEHVVAEDRADGVELRNVDIYYFRQGADLYSLELGFSTEKPSAADLASLTALCPTAP